MLAGDFAAHPKAQAGARFGPCGDEGLKEGPTLRFIVGREGLAASSEVISRSSTQLTFVLLALVVSTCLSGAATLLAPRVSRTTYLATCAKSENGSADK